MNITSVELNAFAEHLRAEEKSAATLEKYMRDARAFCAYAARKEITKTLVADWKQKLTELGYAVRSINSMLAGVNRLLMFLGLPECRVKQIRIQRQTYCPEERELTKAEYLRLLAASRGQDGLNLVIQTICATGIRVSELQYFTVEAVRRGVITVDCKNKTRTVFVPGKLRNMLMNHAKRRRIKAGPIFVGRSGKPMNRSRIWAAMKRLCGAAGVTPSKVFPHNLRKLFARTFYSAEKDLAKLADILGHSSVNTTRIYIMTTGIEHRRIIEGLGLILEQGQNVNYVAARC